MVIESKVFQPEGNHYNEFGILFQNCCTRLTIAMISSFYKQAFMPYSAGNRYKIPGKETEIEKKFRAIYSGSTYLFLNSAEGRQV